jgi:hypothetical protein
MNARTHPSRILLLGLMLMPAACADDATEPKDLLTEIRDATARFADVNVARGAGYESPPNNPCVASPAGGMGFHFSNNALMGINPQAPVSAAGRLTGTDRVIDPLKPEALLYEPQAGGGFKLVGVEYIVFEAAWRAAGNTAPPTMFGVPFEFSADNPATPFDEAHGAEPHYELHVWSVVTNPAGLTAPFNPSVKCS